jgi:DNA modification methylase
MTGRSIHAIELNPAYVDVAVKRWQDFTGQDAIHAETGKTFDGMVASKSKIAA